MAVRIKSLILPLGVFFLALLSFLLTILLAEVFSYFVICGGGTSERCYTILEDSVLPISDTFKRTPAGIATYTDESGKGEWGNITTNVLISIDESLLKIKHCAEDVLDANILITIDPGEKQIFPTVHEENQSTFEMISCTDTNGNQQIEYFYDSYQENVCVMTLGKEIGEYNKIDGAHYRNADGRRVLRGTIPKDFMLILVSNNARFTNGAEGITVRNKGRLVVSVSRLGDLLEHEFGHLLAMVLNLSEEEEEALFKCTPHIDHTIL